MAVDEFLQTQPANVVVQDLTPGWATRTRERPSPAGRLSLTSRCAAALKAQAELDARNQREANES